MARLIHANQATAAKRRVYFHLVDATDGITPETGEATGQPQISTNGGAFTNTGIGTLTHMGNGRYYADLTQAAVATVGDIIETRFKSANTAESVGDSVHVVGFDPDAAFDVDILINRDITESQRGDHTHQGTEVFYVAPTNGNDGNAGTRSAPFATLTAAIAAATDSAHTVIFLVSDAAAGATTLTETGITVNKRYCFIRGPGRDFIITRSNAGDTITITADGCEISGCQIGTAATGSGAGIVVNGSDFTQIRECWINDTQGDGIELVNASNTQIENCVFHESGQGGSGHGLVLDPTGGSVTHTRVRRCDFIGVAGDAIRLASGTVEDNLICDNTIQGSTGWGVNVMAAGVARTLICDNRLDNNTSGGINDSGTNTADINNLPYLTGTDYTAARAAKLDNLDVAVSSVSGLSGTRTITITVEDQDTNPVSSVAVNVYDSGNTNYLGQKLTNGSGVAAINLDDATYSIRLQKDLFQPDNNPETLVVTADASVTYSGTVVTTPAASDPALCRVSGYLRDAGGNLLGGEVINFRADVPEDDDDVNQYTNTVVSVTTATAADPEGWGKGVGYFELDLVRSQDVEISSSAIGFSRVVKAVPNAASQNFATW